MLSKQSGITMIEVMVTLAITTTGLLGISALQLQSNRAVQDSGNRSQAVWMLEDMASRINANSAALANYSTNGVYACGNVPTRCADYDEKGSKKDAAICTTTQVAAFDLWDIACTKGNSFNGNTVRQSYADFISNPRLSITVNAANKQATLSLTWDVRTSGKDAGGNTLYFANESTTDRTATITRQVQL